MGPSRPGELGRPGPRGRRLLGGPPPAATAQRGARGEAGAQAGPPGAGRQEARGPGPAGGVGAPGATLPRGLRFPRNRLPGAAAPPPGAPPPGAPGWLPLAATRGHSLRAASLAGWGRSLRPVREAAGRRAREAPHPPQRPVSLPSARPCREGALRPGASRRPALPVPGRLDRPENIVRPPRPCAARSRPVPVTPLARGRVFPVPSTPGRTKETERLGQEA